jgi:methylated-DNA-[protein]-cysteine S-methyltransferase
MEHAFTKVFNQKLMIVSKDESIIAVCFETTPEFGNYSKHSNLNNESQILNDTKIQLEEYLIGTRTSFDINSYLIGTKFQKRVWKQVNKIPYGQKLSYKDIAKKISRPKSYRAVANAVGKNPIAIMIPCHRVIRSNGNLGGYSGGIDIKKLLLQKEKISWI